MNSPSYPVPKISAGDVSLPRNAGIVARVGKFLDFLPQIVKTETSFDPVFDWVKDHFNDDAEEVMDQSLKILLGNLREHWYRLERPLTALECLIVDFRSSPWVVKSSGNLLQEVAGISEYEGEDRREQKRRSDRIYSMIKNEITF